MAVKAVWNGAVIAEADEDDVQVVEGNVYFPNEAVKDEYLADSSSHTRCWWKGKASYYDVVVDGARNTDAAFYYPKPSRLARRIENHTAFWRGVRVQRD